MKTKIYEDLADLFSLWRDTTLGQKRHEKKEVDFIEDVFKAHSGKIKSVIDLGGGVGLHAGLLLKRGYDVTLFDQSKKALAIAKKNYPKLKIVQGSFEKINLNKKYDAAVCMWSTLSYVLSEKGRQNFYRWQKDYVRELIILDEANFYRYPQKFYKEYLGENDKYKLKVSRRWVLKNNLKKTQFVYEIYDKKTGKTKIVKDAENEQYVTLAQMQKYLGADWSLKYLRGGYSLKGSYDQKDSSRIIAVFTAKK
jgi:SAM-dependent methyltransferase